METTDPVFPGFLETFAETSGLSVSLLVGGVWLSGITTTERAFLEQTMTLFAGACVPQTDEKGSQSEADVLRAEIEIENTLRARLFKHLLSAEVSNENRGRYIHLSRVNMVTVKGITELPHPIVRVSVASVGAVQFGRMRPLDAPPQSQS